MRFNFFKHYEEIIKQTDSYKVLLYILIITFLSFSPIFFGSDFLAYDDNWYIYENKNVINLSWDSIVNMFSSALKGQYSPLGEVYNSFLYYLFGKNATAFKIVALIVHFLNIILLFNILKSVFKDLLLVSMVTWFFAIHPMQVEVIGWLSVMFRNAVFFMLLGYFFYQKYLEHNFEKHWLILVIVCYLLACLTKEQAILFPIGLFLINMNKFDYKWDRRIIVEMIFCGILTLVFGLITIQITKTGGPSIVGMKIPVWQKIQLFINSIFDYSYNFLFPHKLSFSYLYTSSKLDISFFKLTFTIALLCVGVFLSIKNKIFRFGFLWLFGFLSLSLCLSFFGMRLVYMADRYAYIAIVGYSLLFYSFLIFLRNKFPKNNLYLWVGLIFGISYAVISFKRVSVFKNTENLWTNVLEVNPNDHYAHNNLGYHYKTINEIEKATFHYKKALQIDSVNYLAHNNLGDIYSEKKIYDKAIEHYSKSIKKKPTYKIAYINRANAARKANNSEMLISDLKKILEFNPENTALRIVLIKDLFKNGKFQDVIEESNKVLLYDQSNREVYSYIGRSYIHINEFKKAKFFINKEIENTVDNGYYYYLRSICYYQLGNMKNALKDIKYAQKLKYGVSKDYIDLINREHKKLEK